MLSIGNPPPDPPCPCEISQLKSSDERASDKVALQEVEVDLLKSGLDDNNPLPKFSIRDYVFGVRNKDIRANWPFSQKNLKLCLEHGVRDLLPPFQPLDSVRNSAKDCALESTLPDKENLSNFDGEPCEPSDHFKTISSDNGGCNKDLAADLVNTNSVGSEGDKEFASTSTSQSHFEIDSVPTERTSCSGLVSDTLLEAAAAKSEAVGPPVSHKSESTTTQPAVKKCRLIVKLGNTIDRSSNEVVTPNCMPFSETMASKVCPVCKTFSSSSNTTLNAHIDQCLSAESTIKWTSNSKVIKHRIKPRKTRLMVDIYATAASCTLEELDRRNGTCWATSSCLPTQDAEVCAEEKDERLLSVDLKDTGGEGAVYIDANGTKIRILSKLNELSASKAEEYPKHRRLLKRGEGSKFFSTNNKKDHLQKHQKYLKVAHQREKNCSPNPHCGSEIYGDQERIQGVFDKEEHLLQASKVQKQIKPSDSGTIRRWVCSKRTGLSKKTNGKEGLQRLGYNLQRDLVDKSDQSCLGDSYMEGSCVVKSPTPSESPLSSPEKSKRLENSSCEARVNECNEQPPLRKRVGFSSFGSQIGGNVEKPPEQPKRNVKRLRKDASFVHDNSKHPPNYTKNSVPSPGNRPVEINDPLKSSNYWKHHQHAFSSKATKFSSLRKNLLSLKRSSLPGSNFNLSRKHSALKKSRVHCVEELDDVVAWRPDVVEHHDSMQNEAENQARVEGMTNKMSLSQNGILKIRKKRLAVGVSQGEEAVVLKSSHATSQCYDRDVGNCVDSSVGVDGDLADTFGDIESAGKEVQNHGKDIINDPSYGLVVGESVLSLRKSSDNEFQKLTSPSYTGADSMRCVKIFKGSLCGTETPLCSTEPSLGDGQEMFCADAVGEDVIEQNINIVTELESKLGQVNYFSEVDPIPIPGPPGSFLPSPGDMGSEDLQGNSSLTTSRIHSSEDHQDLVDRDSSDSPVSATSAISNSSMVRCGSKSSEKVPVEPHVAQASGFRGAIHDPIVENNAAGQHAQSLGAERTNLDDFKVNVIFPDKPLSFKNDQPCCCSRKESASQGVALNFQESQLLRRRNMTSVPPAMGKQMSCGPNERPSLNLRPEMFTLKSFPSLHSEKMVLPGTKSPEGPISTKVSTDSTLKLPIRGDSDSASPSASNPVLRLMGKNLMVVNQDEDSCSQPRPTQSGVLNDHPNPQFQVLSRVSPSSVENGELHSFDQVVRRDPIVFGQNQHHPVRQGFDVRLSNSFRSHVNYNAMQAPSNASAAMFPSRSMGGGFTAPLELHESKGGYSLSTEQNRPKNGPDTLSCDMERIATAPEPILLRNASYNANPIREIIIIDDTPENGHNSATDATYTEGMRDHQAAPAGISIPKTGEYNSRHLNPLYGSQLQDSPAYDGSRMLHSASFQMAPSRRTNASPVKWNCTSEGSGALHPSSLTSLSSSTVHLRSALYYSPSFL